MRKVLNVGGGGRSLPPRYAGWEQVLLDIDPKVKPDVCCDALRMSKLKPRDYDAVYCSHTVEHFYRHDVNRLLRGFVHVLKEEGFAEIAVPNLKYLVEQAVGKELDDVWYQSPSGPISFHDVLYGFGKPMAAGNLFYAHKCGFTKTALTRELFAAGFAHIAAMEQESNLLAYAFLRKPTAAQLALLEG